MSDVKKRLNITGRCYFKQNKADGAILSFLPNVPIQANASDLLFIMTVPGDDQKYAPAYCRLQDKSKMKSIEQVTFDELENLEEIRSVGYLKETKKGNIVICAPREHKKIDLDKVVIITTIPADGRKSAPCYIRRKVYEKNKGELSNIKTVTVGEVILEVEEDNFSLNIKETVEKINAELI